MSGHQSTRRRLSASARRRLLVAGLLGTVVLVIAALAWRTARDRGGLDPGDPTVASARSAIAAAGAPLFQPVRTRRSVPPAQTTQSPPVAIEVSRKAAEAARASGTLRIELPGVGAYPVRYSREEAAPGGNWTFVGHVDTPLGNLAAVLTFGPDGVFGVLPTPDGRLMHIVTNHGQAWLQPAGGLVPATGAARAPEDSIIPAVGPMAAAASPPLPSPRSGTRSPAPALSAEAVATAAADTTINVLGIYTANLVALRGSASAAETEFVNLVEVANQAHIDSGTIARLKLVAMRQTDYPAATFNGQALADIQQNQLSDGLDVHALRDSVAADLVAMLRPYASGDSTCGIAYLSGGGLQPEWTSADYGYSVSAVDPCGPLVLAHEIGHNLGSHHDAETAAGGFGAYEFSYGFRQDGPPAFATVMAYAAGSQPWIGYFSHPAGANCLGASCGVAGEADNTRSINLMAERISRFRDPPNTISIVDARSVFETDAGNASMAFEVRLSSPAPAGGVRFDIATGGGTASGGSDYEGLNLEGQAIPQGQRSATFQVQVLPDALVEPDETIVATLRNVSGMALFDGRATGVIRNDDPRARIHGRITVPAGSTAPGTPFYLQACSTLGSVHECNNTLVSPPDFEYSVRALEGARTVLWVYPPDPFAEEFHDLGVMGGEIERDILLSRAVFVSGRVRWAASDPAPAGDLQLRATVPYPGGGELTNWLVASGPEYRFRYKLLPGTPLALAVVDPPAPYVAQRIEVGLVVADTVRDIHLRRVPAISISHITTAEDAYPEGGHVVRVRLSAPAPAGGVRFTLQTVDGTAMSDNDYVPFAMPITVPAGSEFSAYYPVSVWNDPWKEDNEAFRITASGIAGAWLPAPGLVQVFDDDGHVRDPWVQDDVNGDRSADLLWRNPSTGANVLWSSAYSDLSLELAPVTGQGWEVAGIGDFDDDRQGDLLWRHAGSGRNTIWLFGSATYQRAVATVADLGWDVAGVGDFNGDDRSDILWRHRRTGSNAIWKSGHSTALQKVAAVTDMEWKVAGTGDFNADGNADILWRHARTGRNVVWRSGSSSSQTAVTAVTDTDWTAAGIGDFNADGRADILWHNDRTGASVVWRSGKSGDQQPMTRVSNLDWKIDAVADYDADGRADVFWRNSATGANVIWLGADSRTRRAVTTVSRAWQATP